MNNFLRYLWCKLCHPRALESIEDEVRQAYGRSAAIATACKAPQIEPIHIFYGLLKTICDSPAGHKWPGEKECEAALEALVRLLAPSSEFVPTRMPLAESVRRLSQDMVATSRRRGPFFIGIDELRHAFARLHDARVDEFASSQGLTL